MSSKTGKTITILKVLLAMETIKFKLIYIIIQLFCSSSLNGNFVNAGYVGHLMMQAKLTLRFGK